MISTVTNKGKARWMIIDGNFNADQLIEFLEALIKDATKKVFLILDNLRAHHSKPVKAWLAERTSHRGLLPAELCTGTESGRAPERRHEARYRRQGPSADQIETESRRRGPHDHDRKIPDRVRAYFQDPRVKYAA